MKINAFVQKSPVVGIMATQLKLSSYLDHKFKNLELSYLEALILATLFFEDRTKIIGPSQIARTILYPLPRISTSISALQNRGYIARDLVKADSRKTKISLSSSGHKKAVQAVGVFNSVEESIEKILSTSQATQINKTLLMLRSEVFMTK